MRSRFTWRPGWPAWIAGLALASSIAGIVNGFTYDDRYVVEMNPAMRDLRHWWRAFTTSYWPKEWGGDGYRPLTILAFKIEYAIGRGGPLVFHAVNILLYTVMAVAVYRLIARLVTREQQWAAVVGGALFAVHPVHVEAVANIVGQSELLVGVAIVAALALYLRDRRERRLGALETRTAFGILALYTIACFAKEHGIVLPALLIAAELTLVDDARPWRERVRGLRPFYLALLLVAVGFLAARSEVMADRGLVGFQPFTPFSALKITRLQRTLTALGVVPQWVRLLLWPAHLQSEYGPPGIEIAQGPSVTQLPGVAILFALCGLCVVLRRRQPIVSFGIAFIAITLLPSSNFLIPAGILLAERTLYLPGVGAMLVVAGGAAGVAAWLNGRKPVPPRLVVWSQLAAGLLIVAGAVRSAQRSTVWHDNDRLFHQAVIDAPAAYRAHFMLGAWDFDNKRKREGEAEYHKALSLFPYDPGLSYNMAEQYRMVGLCGPALPLYRWTHGLDPYFPYGHGAFAWCLLNEGHYDEARARAFDNLRIGADVRGMRRVIFVVDSIHRAPGAGKPAGQNGSQARSGATLSLQGIPSKVPESMQKTAGKGRS